jgi:hypothetical protein
MFKKSLIFLIILFGFGSLIYFWICFLLFLFYITTFCTFNYQFFFMFDLMTLILPLLRRFIWSVFLTVIKTGLWTILWGLVSNIKIWLTQTFYHFGLFLVALTIIFFIIVRNLDGEVWSEKNLFGLFHAFLELFFCYF